MSGLGFPDNFFKIFGYTRTLEEAYLEEREQFRKDDSPTIDKFSDAGMPVDETTLEYLRKSVDY